jgi:hypothetical protein
VEWLDDDSFSPHRIPKAVGAVKAEFTANGNLAICIERMKTK